MCTSFRCVTVYVNVCVLLAVCLNAMALGLWSWRWSWRSCHWPWSGDFGLKYITDGYCSL